MQNIHVEQPDPFKQITTEEAIAEVDLTDKEFVDLSNIRLRSFDQITSFELVRCVEFAARKNLLHHLIPFPEELRKHVEFLDLFDNKITAIGPFFSKSNSPIYLQSPLASLPPPPPQCHFMALRKLDLSYNQIRTIEGLDDLSDTLEELYLIENKISEIKGLDKLHNLKLLELGGNRIRKVGDGLQHLTSLEQLWLGKNKIDRVEGVGFQTLQNLRTLSLQANRFSSINPNMFKEGQHPELEELYLSENNISCIENIETLHSVVLMDFSFNPISTFSKTVSNDTADINNDQSPTTTELTPENFPKLEEFWVSDANISDWSELAVLKRFEETLKTVYLDRNPLSRDPRYRSKVLLELPFISQIDAWPVVKR